MRFQILAFALAVLNLFHESSYSQSVTFNVTTVTDNGNFSPKHVLAIWVKDANGLFVKSIKVNANARIQYLYSWNKNSGGNKVDAITGATLTSHQTHTVTWNCKNTSENLVPSGTYKMMIEYTDQHAQGPIDSISFNISGSSQHVTQADQLYFKNISLDYTPSTTSVDKNKMDDLILSIMPNPSHEIVYASLTTKEHESALLQIIDTKGSIVYSKLELPEKLSNYPIDVSNLPLGTYIFRIIINHKEIKQKIIKN